MTTQEAVEDFARAIMSPSEPNMPPRTAMAQRRASEESLAELHAMGMGQPTKLRHLKQAR